MRPEVFAAEGGEDYELLAAMPASFGDDDAARLRRECGIPLTRVGRVVEGAGVRLTLDGSPVVVTGFDHFDGAMRARR